MSGLDAETLRKFELWTGYHRMVEFGVPLDALAREVVDLRARLAEAEGYAQAVSDTNRDNCDRAEAAEARLAAVLALCDRTRNPASGYRQLADHHAKLTVTEVRAAATGGAR